MQQETVDTIEVLIRIRPFNEREKQEEAKPCFHIDSHSKNTIIFDATAKSETRYFTFDHICNDQATQEEIFTIIGVPTATSCLQGYNGCIFAYGQTGAGKTYTIQGQGLDTSLNQSTSPEENEKRGILPRVVEYMFSNIESAHDTSSNTLYSVKCNFLEIYNEHIIDLLNPTTKNLQIREDLKKGVYIEGLSEEKCTNASSTLETIHRGNRSRHIGSTNMNIESSRSHSVFTLIIEAKISKDGVTNTRRSRFSFVDLAGSERQKMASTVGDRLKEGCLINKSLMVLANVINSLVDISEGKSRFVHYRDSKLTFLLKDSIGGNSKTSIIANISPAMPSYGETLSTLKFAQRAKLIKNKVHINEDTSGTLDGLKGEIFRLRLELANMRNLINIGGIRYSDDKKLSLDFGGIPDIDQNLMQEDIPWIIEEEPRGGQKSNELEVLLKQSLDILTESETHLLSELSKKDDTIDRLKHAKENSDKSEINMRLVIKLLNDKVDRFRGLLQKKILGREDCLDLIDSEQKSELKSRIIHILNESQVDFGSNYPKDFIELKEEHNQLKHDYLKAIEVLSKQGEGVDKMQVEEFQQIEEEFNSLREEYQQMLEAYQRVIDEMNDKNIEIGYLKETLEKHEHEKKIISEEIETLSKAFEEQTKTDYEQKLQDFVEEQEKVLDQFKEEFLLVKNERDNLQNQLNIADSQLQEIGTNHGTLLEEMDSLTSRLLNHGELESKLSSEIEEAQNKIIELVNIDNQQKSEITQLSTEVTILREQNKQFEIKNQDMQNTLESKESEFNEVLSTLKEEISLKAQENSDLKVQISERDQDMNSLNEAYQRIIQEADLRGSQITNMTQEYQSLEQRLLQMTEELRESIETSENFNSQREAMKQEYEQVKEQLQNVLEEKSSIEDQNQKLNESIAQLREEFTSLNETYQKVLQETNLKGSQITNMTQEYQSLEQRLLQMTEEMRETSDNLNSQREAMKQEYEQLKEQLQNLTLEKNSIEDQNQKLNESIAQLREESAQNQQNIIESSQNELSSVRNQYETLIQENTQNSQEIQVLNNKITESQQEAFEKTQKLEELTQQCDNLREQLTRKEQIILQLQSEVENFGQQLLQKEAEITNLKNENLTLNSQFESSEQTLQEKLNSTEKELSNLNAQFETLTQELESLRQDYEKRTLELQKNQEESITMKITFESLKNELDEQKHASQTLQSNYNELKNQHSEQLNELQTLKQEKGEVINKYEELYKAKTLENQELMTLKQEYELSIATNQNLLSQNEELKSSEAKLKDEMKRYMQTVGRLKLDYEKLNQEAGHHNELRQQFELQINEKDQQLHQKSQEVEEAQNEILHKNTALIEKEKELAQYQQELIEYQKNAEIHQKERNMLCTIEESLRKEIQHLSDRLQQLASENDQTSTEFEEKVQGLQNECQSLASNLELTQEELESLKAEKENLTQEKMQLQNQLQQQIITEAAIIKENENHLKKFQKAEKELKLQKDNLQKQNSDLQEKLDNLMVTLENLKKERESIEAENHDLEAALESYSMLETQFKEGENHTHQLQETVQNNESIISQLRTAYEEALKETTHFRSENTTKDKEIARIREDQGKLISEIQNLYVEIQDYKQLEAKLRQEVAEYSQKIANIYGDQEREIKEVKDQYIRLTQEHRTLMRTIASKDEQLLASKEELQVMGQERNQLENEIENYKVSDAKLRQENQEYYEKIARLNGDQYLLLKEIDNLNKANDSLGGHNNMGQKIRHLNKLKEENNKLKAEKNKAMEDLTKALELKDKLQKKLDESGSTTNSNSRGFFDGPRDSTSSTRFEMERKSLHRQNSGSFPDNLSKISSLIHSNLGKDDAKFVNSKSNDVESIANGVQALTMLIMEKNKVIHNRETELESVVLKNSILEKEVLLLKQKMYLSHSNSQSNNLSMNESNTTSNAPKRVQQSSPLQTRAKNRAPTPRRVTGESQNFDKAIEFKLNNIVNNRSNSLKKPEPRLSFDENYIGNSFDSQKVKLVPVKKNLLK